MIEDTIKARIDEQKYKGVVLKLIAIKDGTRYVNYFTSLTLANDRYLNTNDAEWRALSGGKILYLDSEKIKHIIEFETETEKIYFMRKNLLITEFYDVLNRIKSNKELQILDKNIEYDIDMDKYESFTIGSNFSSSIFGAANINLLRMSQVLVVWPNNDNISTIDTIRSAIIDSVKVIMPIETLIGFAEYNIPKELCSSLCIYLPNYRAWLINEKLAGGKNLEVNICAEETAFLKQLVLLYRVNKSDELLLFNTCAVEDIELPKGNSMLKFTQPVGRAVDKSLLILVDRNFNVQDFSSETPYVSRFSVTFDFLSNKRKRRETMNVGEKKLPQDRLTERKTTVSINKETSILFIAGDQNKAIGVLKRVLDAARHDIKIMDPYFGNDPSDWNIFAEIASNINLKILTCLEFRRKVPKNFMSLLTDLRKEITNVEAKSIYAEINCGTQKQFKCPFHDRYFILDDETVWIVGTSINGLGKRDSTITKIDSLKKDEIIDRFCYYWNQSAPLYKELVGNNWIDVTLIRKDL